jgi:hypothetical protein
VLHKWLAPYFLVFCVSAPCTLAQSVPASDNIAPVWPQATQSLPYMQLVSVNHSMRSGTSSMAC